MKTKLERTVELTQEDIRAAIISYVASKQGLDVKDSDVQLRIDPGSSYDGPFDPGRPASVTATVIVRVG